MEPAASASGDPAADESGWRQLDPRKIALDREAGWILTGVLSIGELIATAIVCLAADDDPWLCLLMLGLWVPLTVGLALLAHFWPPVEYRHARYRIDDQLVEIETGVLWRRSVAVPRSRVQHLDVTQGPLQRRHGLGVLSIYTAGTQYSLVSLAGLSHETAQALRDRLLPRETALDGV